MGPGKRGCPQASMGTPIGLVGHIICGLLQIVSGDLRAPGVAISLAKPKAEGLEFDLRLFAKYLDTMF